MPNLPENQETADADEVKTHIKLLTDPNFVVRHNAQKALQRLGTEAITALIEEFEKEFQRYTRREVLIGKIGKCGLAVGISLIFTSFVLINHDGSMNAARFLLVSSSSLIMASLFFRLFGSDLPERLKAVYDVLVEMDDPRIFSILLEMYQTNPAWSSDKTLNLLTVHLPQTTLSQWEGLSAKHRKALYHLVENRGQINTKRCYEFTLAALTALEQFGDMEAIPAVQHVAKHGSNAGLRSAAVHCLPYLEMRREEQSIRQTLLRASQSTGGRNELLRIPTHAPDTENEQLLRMPPQE